MKVTVHKHTFGLIEGRVVTMINDAGRYAEDIDGFIRWVESGLKEMEGKNNVRPEHSYELVKTGKNYAGFIVVDRVLIWHRTPSGDRDRLIATIIK